MDQSEGSVTTLLIVDDQPDFCALIKELLLPYKEFGVVGEAYDGLTCLQMAEDLQPDLILLDVEMPGLHGLETASEMRNRFPDITVVLMSAYHKPEYMVRPMPLGASDFIAKSSFSIDRLRQVCGPVRISNLRRRPVSLQTA